MSTSDRKLASLRHDAAITGRTQSPAGTASASGSGDSFFGLSSLGSISAASSLPTAPSISLPNGGGAITGMGEKFNVDQSTGVCSMSIPIGLSSARGGMTPGLSINYNSGSGNGEFGLGWHLHGSIAITRKTSKGLPLYNDSVLGSDEDSDVFLISDAEDLVPVFKKSTTGAVVLDSNGNALVDEITQDNYRIRRYVPRIMQTFARIERWTNLDIPDDIHWRVLTPDNHTMILGRDSNSRIYDPTSKGSSTIRIFSWLQSEAWDVYGNAIIYGYKAENSDNVPINAANENNRTAVSRTSNRYLKYVKYGNISPNRDPSTWLASSALQLPDDNWKFSVVFDYGEHDENSPTPQESNSWTCRQDPFSTYHAGYEIRTYRICQRVLLFHHFDELGQEPFIVSSLELSYLQSPAITFLQSATHSGYLVDETTKKLIKKSLPAVGFEYQPFSLENLSVDVIDDSSVQNLPVGLDLTTYRWVDLDGEGLSGILTNQGGAWWYKRNTSANNFVDDSSEPTSYGGSTRVAARLGELELLHSNPSLSLGGQTPTHFADIHGAGKLDLVETSPSAWGFFERNSSSPNGWDNYQTFRTFPAVDTTSKDVKFVDLTGDGLPDILICDDQVFTWYPSLGADGYGLGQTATQPSSEDSGPVCLFSDTEQTLYLADMSGGGLSDIVRIRNSDICYWPNCGYGKFGSLVRMDHAPLFDRRDTFNESRIRLADIDGSGTTDIVYLSTSGIDIYLNQSGNSFSDRQSLGSLFPLDDTSSVNTVDLLGNGTSCIVWSSALPSLSRQPLRYIDLNKGIKPYLLFRVVNNLGSETVVHYAPSTKFYLDDLQNGTPWITSLPFPVHCVERVETVDHISQSRFAQRYSYHHGYFDGVEREFRGFARTDCWDTDSYAVLATSSSANIDAAWNLSPVRTTSWFHTGVFFGADSWSHQLAHEYYGASNQPPNDLSGPLLPDSVIPPNNLSDDALRESFRALKGHLLRKEVYGEDGSDKAMTPYLIQESNFTINIAQDVQDFHHHSVYSVFPREAISCHSERNSSDPRIEHSLILEQDSFGNSKRSIKVVYGRRAGNSPLAGSDKAKQETPLLLYTETELTDVLSTSGDYRVPTIHESRGYQVSGFSPASGASRFAFTDFAGENSDFLPLDSLTEIPFEIENDNKKRQKRLIQRSRVLFRKDDFAGLLPPGQTGSLSLPGQTYTKCFTPGLISSAYTLQGSPLISDAKSLLANGIGNTKLGYVDLDGDGSWWKTTGNVYFSAIPASNPHTELAEARAHFFQPLSFVDIFGNSTIVTYDSYNLIPIHVVNPVGNMVSATVNYRVLKHRLVTDANGNQVEAAFDALGMVSGIADMGKPGSNADSLVGFKAELTPEDLDTIISTPKSAAAFALLGNATRRTFYDYTRFARSKQPAFSGSIARVWRVDPTQPPKTDVHIDFSYSDGSGRVIQHKVQAKPGPLVDGGGSISTRWIGSGWTIFNNKGNPVRQYQPYFDDTPDFKFDMKVGPSTIKIYDALSRVVASLQPDHTLAKHSFDGWSTTASDPNDNVNVDDPRADLDVGHLIHDLPEHEFLPSWYNQRINGQQGAFPKQAAEKAAPHAQTPHITHFDVLGRAILQVNDAGGGQLLYQRVDYDISGHIRRSYDANGCICEQTDVSMDGQVIHRASMEAGERWNLADAQNEAALSWNSRGMRFRYVYDGAKRLLESWVMEGSGGESLVRQNVYGESAPDAAAHNLRGRLYRANDQSGQYTHNDYDYLGNLLIAERTLAQNYKDILDWSGQIGFENESFTVSATFDALSRPIVSVSPDATVIHRTYNETGHVEVISVNVRNEQPSQDPSKWTPIVSGVDHNANGQLLSTIYGNGVTCKRAYEPLMYRLLSIQSYGPGSTSGPASLQNLNYTFDAVGNVTHIQDQAQQDIFFRNSRIDPSLDYTFDATYRLISATGREHLGQTNGQPQGATPPGPFTGSISDSPADGKAVGQYTESYEYDKAGNILSIAHALSDGTYPGWKRLYTYNELSQLNSGQVSNRLSSTSIGSASGLYAYDIHGNMTSMPEIRLMEWDYADRLRATSKQVVNNGTPETTYYVYDDDGNRVRKVTESASGGSGPVAPSRIKDRIYINGWEIFRTFKPGNNQPKSERVSLSVDDEGMISCRIDTQTIQDPSSNLPSRVVRFELDNHLNSVSLILDEEAHLVSYEEYFPHGGTAFESTGSQSEVPKRYRYCGKERDDETGLYAYGQRYLAPWLGRWTSADPGGTTDGFNLYQFVHNNPIVLHDPDGGWAAVLAPLIPIITTEAAASAPEGPPGWLVGAVVITGTLLVGLAINSLSSSPALTQPVPNVPRPASSVQPPPPPPPAIPVPQTPTIPVPLVPPITQPVPVPRAVPRAVPRSVPRAVPMSPPMHPEKKDEDKKKKKKPEEDEEEEDKDKGGPMQQHHIFAKQYKWFFDALGIDIDLAENTIMLPPGEHTALHKVWNPAWKLLIESYVDWDALKAGGPGNLKFHDPFHHDAAGNPESISTAEMALMVYALGMLLRAGLLLSGVGKPAMKDYGSYRNKELYERRPLSRDVMNMSAAEANRRGLLGPRLKGGILVP